MAKGDVNLKLGVDTEEAEGALRNMLKIFYGEKYMKEMEQDRRVKKQLKATLAVLTVIGAGAIVTVFIAAAIVAMKGALSVQF